MAASGSVSGMSPWELGLLIGSLAFAGLVKGVTGFGLPLFATPILAGVFGARQAVVIMSIPAFVSNLAVLYASRRAALLVAHELWLLTVAGAVGVVLGLLLLARIDQNVLALVIAGIVFLFLARGDRLLGRDPRALRMRVMGPLIGGLSGLLNGGTSIAGPLLATYLHARRLSSAEFVASVAVVVQVFSIVQIVGLWQLGLYDRAIVVTGLLSLLPSLLFVAIGVRVRKRVNGAVFRIVISLLLILSALNLIVQGLKGLGVFH